MTESLLYGVDDDIGSACGICGSMEHIEEYHTPANDATRRDRRSNTFRCAGCGRRIAPGEPCRCTASAPDDAGEEYLEAQACRQDFNY